VVKKSLFMVPGDQPIPDFSVSWINWQTSAIGNKAPIELIDRSVAYGRLEARGRYLE
jgi:hypothetical protein